MERYELIVVGAGPAGLSAAIEAAKAGMKTVVFDENAKPGGQLFKQIHKFFGSKEHKAKIRGYNIGETLLREAETCGVEVVLNATVAGVYEGRELTVMQGDSIKHFKGDSIVVATGASENMVTFPGWTLPGVIGAGAAQTMMNLHGIKPGSRVLMLGTGNVGLVVSYQLLQAGCEVVALVDASKKIGGYGVHAAKVARTGVPFYLSHTIVAVHGEDCVKGVTIGEVDAAWQVIPGSEKTFDVDTVCLAVGLSPMAQLVKSAGCEMNGIVPAVDAYGATSVPGIYAAGDVSGIEEASSAMIEGRIAGAAAAYQAGYLEKSDFESIVTAHEASLGSLREGMFGPKQRGRVQTVTEEGIVLSQSLLTKGYLDESDLAHFPSIQHGKTGVYPVIECTQNIPCNPCQDACVKGCILIGNDITSLPVINAEATCTGCGMCVASCSGQAIFLVEEKPLESTAYVSFPYEFLPLPEKGDRGIALDRSGAPICDAEITAVRTGKAMDQTHVVTMKVPLDYASTARFFRRR
ncbi:FAD-dependent oxidoreductase [Fusibacter paucivorans]|uniref:FAD-dependent oxidoreductase n=1 Tax=Fusibacter paucivorans TaxID=76009 RepID=A0ABS5PJ60_9FIRM|nr:FAD-dependent oxidoreductase [Fusibacter paucivorans]MBS7525110.1 FAD-dependent oxidoreductase [Fusibacter paucivorans]